MNIETMKEKYLEYVLITKAKRTYDCYQNHLDFLSKIFIENNISNPSDINNSFLKKFIIQSHKRKNTNRTINLRIQILKSMFKFNEIKNDDLFSMQCLKEEKNTFIALSNKELHDILDYINSDVLKFKNKLMLFILIDTGIRINELLNIKIENINFYNNTIYLVNTKSHKPRFVPFGEGIGVMIRQYIQQFNVVDKLFDMTYYGCVAVFNRIKKKLKLNKFHPHMLRHTFASRLHKNGATIFVIQNLLGHSNVNITERYIHFDLEDIIADFKRCNYY